MKKFFLLIIFVIFINIVGNDLVFGQESYKPEPLFPVSLDSNKAYIDKTGKKVLELGQEFSYIDFFYSGLAKVLVSNNQGHKWGYINTTGKLVITPKFQEAQPFSDGLACVKMDELYGYIDKTGKLVIEPKFYAAEPFQEGVAKVSIGSERWIYIDTTGNPITDQVFEYGWFCSDGLIAVKQSGKWGFINKTGKVVIPFTFGQAAPFSEGLAGVSSDKGAGFIDKTGKIVIKSNFTSSFPFSENLAAVVIDGKWGFIDTSGQVVIDPIYEEAQPFSDGVAAVKLSGKWGFINKKGKIVIEPFFDLSYGSNVRVFRFTQGLSRVEFDNSSWGYIDRKGSFVWNISK